MAVILPVPESERVVLNNLLTDLNEAYPDKVISGLGKDHKKWDEKVTRLYRSIGYASREDFLAAYGFTVKRGKVGAPAGDLKGIVNELISRYEGDRVAHSMDQLKDENPDLAPKFKNIQNQAQDLFGTSFVKYLKEKGVIVVEKKVKTQEEIAAEKEKRAEDRKESARAAKKNALKDFDEQLQQNLLGWKTLEGLEEAEFWKAANPNRLMFKLNIDKEEHFRSLGIPEMDDAERELRKLIRAIDFQDLLSHVPLNWSKSTIEDKTIIGEPENNIAEEKAVEPETVRKEETAVRDNAPIRVDITEPPKKDTIPTKREQDSAGIDTSLPTYNINNFIIRNDAVCDIRHITKGEMIFPKGLKIISVSKNFHITKVVIPEGVTHINRDLIFYVNQFYDISDIYIPDSLIGFIDSAIDNVKTTTYEKNSNGNYARVHVNDNPLFETLLDKCGVEIVKEHWQDQFAFLEYSSDADNDFKIEKGVLVDCSIRDKRIVVPDGVKKIGIEAFCALTDLEEVVLPEGVTEIGKRAFLYCTNLKKVIIPKTLKKIKDGAFTCSGIEEVSVPDTVVDIGSGFINCRKLKAIKLPEGITEIVDWAFHDCHLESVELPDSVVQIGRNAFEGCASLNRIKLPEGLKKIDHCAFNGCVSLKELVIPESVQDIGSVGMSWDNQIVWDHCPFDGTLGGTRAEVYRNLPIKLKTYKDSAADRFLSQLGMPHEIQLTPEQALTEEKTKLKARASQLQDKLLSLISEDMTDDQLMSVVDRVRTTFSSNCDKQTWDRMRELVSPVFTSTILEGTTLNLSEGTSPETVYDDLPQWVADDFIKEAKSRRIMKEFEKVLTELTVITNKSVVWDYENGMTKDTIVYQASNDAKNIINSFSTFEECLIQNSSNAQLNRLCASLSTSQLLTADQVIEKIAGRKMEQFDRLAKLDAERKDAILLIEKEETDLKEEAAHLGIFKGKRKKEIAELLEKMPDRIKAVEDEFNRKKREL